MPRFSLSRSALLVLAMAVLPAVGRAQGVVAVNDAIANATVIGTLPFSYTANNVVSSFGPGDPGYGPGDPGSCAAIVDGSVWYSFTPAVTTSVFVNVDFSVAVSVFTGSPGMLEGMCGTASTASFIATPGATYFIRLETRGSAAGNTYTFTVTGTTPPPTVIAPNDDFANATLIGGLPFSDTADGVVSSLGPGDPSSCTGGMATGSVWYSFTPTVTTSVLVTFDAMIAVRAVSVFTGSPGTLDGTCGGSFIATAGTTYFIRLEMYTGNFASTYTLTVTGMTPPPNDGFGEAHVIDAVPFSQTVDATLASAAPDDPFPSCAGAVPTATVWYSFTSELPVRLRLSADASVASVYTGSPGSLTEVACTSGAIINFSPGVAYSIMVSGNATSYTFTMEAVPAAPVITLTVDPWGSVDKSGVAMVTGTVTCSGAPSVDVSGTLQQFGPRRLVVLGYFGTSAACTGQPVTWTASAVAAGASNCGCSSTTQLGPGPGTITANATACGPLECTPSGTTGAIRLR